jgi:hypothetical protein
MEPQAIIKNVHMSKQAARAQTQHSHCRILIGLHITQNHSTMVSILASYWNSLASNQARCPLNWRFSFQPPRQMLKEFFKISPIYFLVKEREKERRREREREGSKSIRFCKTIPPPRKTACPIRPFSTNMHSTQHIWSTAQERELSLHFLT